MMSRSNFDHILLGLIVIALMASVAIYLVNYDFFYVSFAAEDGIVEYATAIFLFVASLVLVRNALSLSRQQKIAAALFTAFYALLFFMAAGEEVSWGQRIFGWESGEFFQENNFQDETNLHNMVVGEFHLAKTLFGSVLTTIILLYLVALPLLYSRAEWVRKFADRLAVPVPGLRHAVFAIGASLVIVALDVPRRWEVYELVFSLLATSIFLLPQNREKIS